MTPTPDRELMAIIDEYVMFAYDRGQSYLRLIKWAEKREKPLQDVANQFIDKVRLLEKENADLKKENERIIIGNTHLKKRMEKWKLRYDWRCNDIANQDKEIEDLKRHNFVFSQFENIAEYEEAWMDLSNEYRAQIKELMKNQLTATDALYIDQNDMLKRANKDLKKQVEELKKNDAFFSPKYKEMQHRLDEAENKIAICTKCSKQFYSPREYMNRHCPFCSSDLKKDCLIVEMQTRLDLAIEWIKKSHHLDGCIRTKQPYPLRNKKEDCDCGRKDTLTKLKEKL